MTDPLVPDSARAVVAGLALKWATLREGCPPDGLGLWVPTDADDVLLSFDNDDFLDTDGRIPYFATLWPSAFALVDRILDGPDWTGQRTLDLGCGLGAVGLAAAARGARISFLDWEPRAVAVAKHSAASLGFTVEHAWAADWREPPPFKPFDRIVAADVLYEDRNLPAVVRFLATALAPAGTAWIADPGRRQADDFIPAAEGEGLTVSDLVVLPEVDGIEVMVLEVQSSSHPNG